MKYLLPLVTLWISFCAESSQSTSFESRVAGGEVASIKQVPYLVGILPGYEYSSSTYCAGSLFNFNWVFTAAQCIASAKDANLVFGSTNLQVVDLEAVIIKVDTDAFHIFPNYNPVNHSHDIALIKLPYALHLEDRIRPLPLMLPENPKNLFVGEKAIVSGWGEKSNSISSGFAVLRSDELFIKEKGYCNVLYESEIDEGIICATSTACFGDIGSPLVYNGRLTGILSIVLSSDCEAHRNNPVAFTRIDNYYNWIIEVIFNNV